jgi:hypothetical protein
MGKPVKTRQLIKRYRTENKITYVQSGREAWFICHLHDADEIIDPKNIALHCISHEKKEQHLKGVN